MLSVRQAADKPGVPPVSVRLWARSGRFPGAELKKTELGVPYWVIPEASLAGFTKAKPGPKGKIKTNNTSSKATPKASAKKAK